MTIPTTRRSFFGVAGGAALLCTIGGKEVDLSSPGGLEKADAAAARVRRPRAAAAQAVPQIQPAPGGHPARVLDPGRDRALGDHADAPRRLAQPQPPGSRTRYTAFVYRLMTPGFAGYATKNPSIPGPTLIAEVGDVLVVHFRNADRKLQPGGDDAPARRQVQPGVRRRLHGRVHARGRLHRARRVVHLPVGVHAPVGRRLAVPRPRAQPHAQHVPRPVRRDHRPRPRREGPDRVYTLFAHQLPPPVTRLQRNFHCINGRAYAGNTPTLTARVGEDVEIHAFGMDSNFHTFHIHGHRWKDPAGTFTDNPAMGPNESVTARFVEDNPGRWLYHCHVFSHQDAGMAGWYVVDP